MATLLAPQRPAQTAPRPAKSAAGRNANRTRADDQLTLEQIQQATAEKESRSAGAGGLAAMIERFGGEQIRFFLLRTHYRSTVVFSDEALAESSAALETFYRFFERYERVTGQRFYDLPAARTRDAGALRSRHRSAAAGRRALPRRLPRQDGRRFQQRRAPSAICLNSSALLNKFVDQHKLEDAARPDSAALATALQTGARALRELSALLGIFRQPRETASAAEDSSLVGQLMDLLIELRAAARKNKDFATADRIRDALSDDGCRAGRPQGRHALAAAVARTIMPDDKLSSTNHLPRVLGIDPGLNTTGYGVLERSRRARCSVKRASCGAEPSGSLEARLAEIYEGVRDVIRSLTPQVMAVEELYSHYERPRTAILMGHARGVICLAAAEAHMPVQALCGHAGQTPPDRQRPGVESCRSSRRSAANCRWPRRPNRPTSPTRWPSRCAISTSINRKVMLS